MKRAAVAVLAAPFVVEVARIAWVQVNRWFDAWFVAQLKKAWRASNN